MILLLCRLYETLSNLYSFECYVHINIIVVIGIHLYLDIYLQRNV